MYILITQRNSIFLVEERKYIARIYHVSNAEYRKSILFLDCPECNISLVGGGEIYHWNIFL